ncbi:MAG: 5-methyltetrahydropteroyltriglutamate--homocysteine S-methyltransferase [Candidatus Glassbacteria bacterium]|nr:5-methyltetrahydropteroyltriglutamate--homocysteine S-methyltransferase [Candidatus Glassbacteria bacterium]
MQAGILGFPRIGADRELKLATEAYWRAEIDLAELENRARAVRVENYGFLKSAGLDLIPAGDFSYYDKVLDTCCMTGALPGRFSFEPGQVSLESYFELARGARTGRGNIHPMSMVKWFNTNYHYLVPELDRGTVFSFRDSTVLRLVDEALELEVPAMPVLIGPVSFLLLGRPTDGVEPLSLLESLLPVYREVLEALAAKGVRWVQMDEPCFAGPVGDRARDALKTAYTALAQAADPAGIVVQTYFDHVGANYDTLCALPTAGLGLDFVHGPDNLDFIERKGFPGDKTLFAGLVDGRSIWVCDPDSVLALAGRLLEKIDSENLVLSSSCSLMHVPVTVAPETHLPAEVFNSMAFAREKVRELVALARTIGGQAGPGDTLVLERARQALAAGRSGPLKKSSAVRERIGALTPESFARSSPSAARLAAQAKTLKLPLLPTTTIGSFPQTAEVRKLRARFKKGELTEERYKQAIRQEIRKVVELQQEIGLDVLVHGEFERTDMVEYFGEQLEGFYFLKKGWVVSYGSRCVKPPVIYGDVSRPGQMTVEWSQFAQSLTARPMKGMLTGPATILNWSFVRDDIPRSEVCFQVALAVRDEVADLEKAGIKVIQIDEPALREGLPLQPEKRSEYLRWAVDAFLLASASAGAETQVHTHMCYSDFNTIIDQIIRMDADVISIENSRAGGRLLGVFREREYPNQIGPGIWDIHSPLVPGEEEITGRIESILEVLPAGKVWVNPDCGLKTRGYQEVEPSLRNMVASARKVRARLEAQQGRPVTPPGVPGETGAEASSDSQAKPRYHGQILEIIRGAFGTSPGLSYHSVFLFPLVERGESRWGFLIATRRESEERLELAAYSYEISDQGEVSKKLESRKASLPEDKLDEVLEGLILRMDELEGNYREIDLRGRGDSQAQLEHLEKILLGAMDGTRTDSPEGLQPGESAEHERHPGHGGSEP